MRDYDLSRARHHQTRVEGSVRRTTVRTGHHAIRQRGSETNCNAASADLSPLRQSEWLLKIIAIENNSSWVCIDAR